MSCSNSNSNSVYCSPAGNADLYENNTYAFDYNSEYWTIWGNKTVDIYLYHADNGQLATRKTGITNNGEWLFGIDQV